MKGECKMKPVVEALKLNGSKKGKKTFATLKSKGNSKVAGGNYCSDVC